MTKRYPVVYSKCKDNDFLVRQLEVTVPKRKQTGDSVRAA